MDLDVCFASDDTYTLPLSVALASLLDHLGEANSLSIFVLDYGISLQSRQRLESQCREASTSIDIRLHFIGVKEEASVQGMVEWMLSDPAWGRILVPLVLPSSVKRVLYLDCDILVLHSLTEVWEMSLEEHAVGGVIDVEYPTGHAGLSKYGWKPGTPYLNAGVLVLNLAQLHSDGTAHELLAKAKDLGPQLILGDQDLLNLVLLGNWKHIQCAWNAQGLETYAKFCVDRPDGAFTEEEYARLVADPCIVHFTGTFDAEMRITRLLSPYVPFDCKPWDYLCEYSPNPFKDVWWEYKRRGPWHEWEPLEGTLVQDVAAEIMCFARKVESAHPEVRNSSIAREIAHRLLDT